MSRFGDVTQKGSHSRREVGFQERPADKYGNGRDHQFCNKYPETKHVKWQIWIIEFGDIFGIDQKSSLRVFGQLNSMANLAPIENSQRTLLIDAKCITKLNDPNLPFDMFCFRILVAKLMVSTIAVFVCWSLLKSDLPRKMASLSRDITTGFNFKTPPNLSDSERKNPW